MEVSKHEGIRARVGVYAGLLSFMELPDCPWRCKGAAGLDPLTKKHGGMSLGSGLGLGFSDLGM